MTKGAAALLGGREVKVVRELGARTLPTYAAHWSIGNTSELVVLQKRPLDDDDPNVEETLARAAAVAKLRHPNVARVREAGRVGDELWMVSDWIDGVTLGDLVDRAAEAMRPIPLAATVKVLLDVLTGLTAIHGLRDRSGRSLGVLHGAMATDQIVIGLDGQVRVLAAVPGAATLQAQGSPMVRFAAPELLLGDDATDGRIDLYAVGVMLWEAIADRLLFTETTAGAILSRHLSGKLQPPPPRATPPWASPLGELAHRTIATDPASRPATAAQLAAEIRRHVGPHAAKPNELAALVETLAGKAIGARREALAPAGGKTKGGPPMGRRPMSASTPGVLGAPVAPVAPQPPATLPADASTPSGIRAAAVSAPSIGAAEPIAPTRGTLPGQGPLGGLARVTRPTAPRAAIAPQPTEELSADDIEIALPSVPPPEPPATTTLPGAAPSPSAVATLMPMPLAMAPDVAVPIAAGLPGERLEAAPTATAQPSVPMESTGDGARPGEAPVALVPTALPSAMPSAMPSDAPPPTDRRRRARILVPALLLAGLVVLSLLLLCRRSQTPTDAQAPRPKPNPTTATTAPTVAAAATDVPTATPTPTPTPATAAAPTGALVDPRPSPTVNVDPSIPTAAPTATATAAATTIAAPTSTTTAATSPPNATAAATAPAKPPGKPKPAYDPLGI